MRYLEKGIGNINLVLILAVILAALMFKVLIFGEPTAPAQSLQACGESHNRGEVASLQDCKDVVSASK